MQESSGQPPGMESRLLLALVLSFLVVMLWQFLFAPPRHLEEAVKEPDGAVVAQPAQEKEKLPPEPSPEAAPKEEKPPPPPPAEEKPEQVFVLSNEFLEVELTNRGAGIRRVTLADYYRTAEGRAANDAADRYVLFDFEEDNVGVLAQPAASLMLLAEGAPDLEGRTWTIAQKDAGAVVFETTVGETTFRKALALPPGKRHVEIRITQEGPSLPYGVSTPFGVRPEKGRSPRDDELQCHIGIVKENGQVYATSYGVIGETIDPAPEKRRVAWGAVSRTFFAAILRALPAREGTVCPDFVAAGRVEIRPDHRAVVTALEEEAAKLGLSRDELAAATVKEIEQKAPRTARVVLTTKDRNAVDDAYELYLGPKDPKILAAYGPADYALTIKYGYALAPDFLVKIFLKTLKVLQAVVVDYGVAIVLLTVLVKLLLHPLNRKNQKSMQRYQQKISAIQPELNRVKERYKNNRRKMHEEMQKLMHEHGANPQQMLGGCLLMFLQLPIWVALISVFRFAIEIRQSPAFFGLITDLGLPDRAIFLGRKLPLVGWEYLNALPIIYVALTVVQQKLMPKPKDEQARSQQRMMSFMMIFIGFIFYNFASGLLIYFLTSSALGIVEQQIIRRELAAEKSPEAPQVAPRPARPEPKQQQQQYKKKKKRKRRR